MEKDLIAVEETVEVKPLTPKLAKVLSILQGADKPMLAAEIAAVDPTEFDKGQKSVSPVLVHLGKRGLAANVGKRDVKVMNAEGNEEIRTYAVYEATAEGKAFDIEA